MYIMVHLFFDDLFLINDILRARPRLGYVKYQCEYEKLIANMRYQLEELI